MGKLGEGAVEGVDFGREREQAGRVFLGELEFQVGQKGLDWDYFHFYVH